MNNILVRIARIGFIGWIIFELLNWIGVLNFTLDFTWIGLVITAVFVWVAIELISHHLKKATGEGLPWSIYFISLFGITWDALGDVVHWYAQFVWYDQAAHIIGGSALGIVAFITLWRLNQAKKIILPRWLLNTLSLTIANMVGVLYEVEEYTEDIISLSDRLGSGVDTVNDMLLNLVGALVFIFIADWYVHHIQRKKSSESISS